MATNNAKTQCVTCKKAEATSRCAGCLQEFCFSHLAEHRQELNKQLDEMEVHRDLFLETLQQQIADPNKHLFFQQVDQWEHESIQKIKQTAEEVRQLLSIHTNENIHPIKEKLSRFTDELKRSREQDDVMEDDLQRWREALQQMKEQLNNPSNIIIQQTSTALVNKIRVDFSGLVPTPSINTNAKWTPDGVVVAGGNGHGNAIHQLSGPWGVYVDDDQTIYVADQYNHRIVEWKKGATISQVVAGGKGEGYRNDQLNCPTSVIMDKKNDALIICDRRNQRVVRWPRRDDATGEILVSNIDCYGVSMDNDGYLYVSDIAKDEVRRWKMGDMNGTLVAGGNGRGTRLDQLHQPYSIFVDQDQSVYVSDCSNHRVVKWMKGAREGVVVAGGQGRGISMSKLSQPRGIVVDQLGTVYVVEYGNQRVTRWLKGAREGSVVVGWNGHGAQLNQFSAPVGLFFDRQNNLYVVDHGNHRVQKFEIEATSTASS